MATAMVSAAVSVVGKALAPVTGSLLEDWAASMELGDNVNALELELLTVQALLEPTLGREIDNSALKELLLRLQGLAYDADDVLDELDYFRIQDELDGTSEAADKHPKGFVHNLALNAKAVGKQIICLPTCLSSDATPGAKAANRRQVNRAKTVGRLLKKQLDLVHWTRVLESKEWEQSDGDNDIMPALKLSYDYLTLQLQQCFYYCALFPQDYKFEQEELINFWIGLDVLHSSRGENKSVEDIGLSHLMQLVNHGFFEEEKKEGKKLYILHDLLHELAQKVSSHECLCIDSPKVRSLPIPPSIRHLSINIDDTSVNGRLTFKNCLEDFSTFIKRLRVEKLRSLMLFGEYQGCFVKVFINLFREAKALRVILLSVASYDVGDLLHNFYNLVHLRYLRIQCCSIFERGIGDHRHDRHYNHYCHITQDFQTKFPDFIT